MSSTSASCSIPASTKASQAADEYVGFANLINQYHREAVRDGFDFTILVAGGSGLGRSTAINALFQSDVFVHEPLPSSKDLMEEKMELVSSTVELREKGVFLRLTIVDTPRFGDAVDNTGCVDPIIDYAEAMNERFFANEMSPDRVGGSPEQRDQRIHCCLYFLPPGGHGLRELDAVCMERLARVSNVIPVIGKADTMNSQEKAVYKKRILDDIAAKDISIYTFPEPSQEDIEDGEVDPRDYVPFSLVTSGVTVDPKTGEPTRTRTYPWGTVDSEDAGHSDFTIMRDALIRTHMQDLINTTHEKFYLHFRKSKLEAYAAEGLSPEASDEVKSVEQRVADQIEVRRQQLTEKFSLKVAEKEKKLEEIKAQKEAAVRELRTEVAQLRESLEKRKEEFMKEKQEAALEGKRMSDSMNDKKPARRSIEKKSKAAAKAIQGSENRPPPPPPLGAKTKKLARIFS